MTGQPPEYAPARSESESRDEHWLRHVYQGDRVPQLTLRAVLMGAFLGTLMAASNLYTTLKLGWSFGVVVTAAVLSFALWNVVRVLSGGRVGAMSVLENNCMASCASAAGYSTGSTVGVAFGALLLLQGQHQPWPVVATYVLFTGGLGVFLAIPMKRRMINREQLPFPTGTAAAETLRTLYEAGGTAARKAYGLLAALAASMIVGLLRSWGTLVDALAGIGRDVGALQRLQKWLTIPESVPFTGPLNPLSRGQPAGLAFEPSVLLVGAGMLMGPRVTLSMLAGSVLLYYVVAPAMAAQDAARLGEAGFMATFAYRPDGSFNPVRWGLWGGTALMVFASLTVLALDWRTLARALSRSKDTTTTAVDRELAAIEVPGRWFLYGLVPFGIGTVVVLRLAFGVSVPLGILAVLLTIVVSLVCSRATGETDTTPIGPMGKLTQLVYGILPGAAGNTAINLMTAGATTSAGMASADLLTDLKSGYLLGAHPRKQFFAQLVGVLVGTLAVVPAWYLMVPNLQRLEAFNPPATNMWKAVADLLTQGVRSLPPSALWIIAIGATLGVALPLVERLAPKARPYLPSAIGLGFSWAFVFQNSLSFAIGALAVWAWSRMHPKNADTYAIPVASGFIAGESLVAAAIAIACTVVGFFAKG
ncbi:MAG: OPT/YSL family transporter [Verrucomicrobiales bacterium]|nr:OPT/YSL family transporter [Verrucomicrobiales bacterium]